jgi:glycosyltransferase involved in cell wall biosynthesis
MTEKPTVSVVIPTYDRPEMLSRAVRSVVGQTYEPIELIVVDDHSPTPAGEVVDQISTESLSSLRCLRHEENQGGSAARATGIEAATGEYVAFLDDDDEWEPSKIEKQVDRVRSASEDHVLVYTGIRQVNADGSTNAVKTPTAEGDVVERLLRGNFIGSYSAVMVSSNAIDAVGLPDERFPSWQDWEWYLRLAQEGVFLSVPEPLVIRHNGHDQMSSNFETKRDVSYPLLIQKGQIIARECGCEQEFKSGAAFELAWAAVENGEFGEARRYLFKSLRLNPWSRSGWFYLLLILGGRFTFYPVQQLKRAAVGGGDI